MKRVALLAVALALLSGSVEAYAQITYTIMDVGQLGSWGSTGRGINNAGQVVGGSSIQGTQSDHAYRWSPGDGIIGLGTLGGTESRAFGINAQGNVVGWAAPSGGGYPERHAFLWVEGSGMTDLGTLGGTSQAYDVNAAQQILGTSNNQPFFWEPGGSMANANTLLPSGSGWSISTATGINDDGLIVGAGTNPSGQGHAFLLDPLSTIVDLGALDSDGSSASDLNAVGMVVGSLSYGSIQRGFLWDNVGGMIDIGTLGGTQTWVTGINDIGQIVGKSLTVGDAATHFFLWSWGMMFDMTELTADAGWSIDTIAGISDFGIVGWGVPPSGGYKHAFVLTVIPDPYHVTSLDDPGQPGDGFVTLREAIAAANAAGEPVTITFATSLSGGTIQPASPLPFITNGSITINGDVNGDCIPDIELDGTLAGDAHGLVIASAGNEIRGLTVIRFAFTGITVQGTAAESNTITCCYVGTDASGNMNLGNGREGVFIQGGSPGNSIGPWNVISGNALSGILVEGATATNNAVFQNFVGTDPSGAFALPNEGSGVVLRFDAHHNSVGPGNVVSGNNSHGIVLSNGVNNTLVFGDKCGTDLSGTYSIPNSNSGILIQVESFDNTIGGFGPGDGNLCSGNLASGIVIADTGSDFNTVTGNKCGTTVDGGSALPNGIHGIHLYNAATSNHIGPGNVISGNTSNGIRVSGIGTNLNEVVGNNIGMDVSGAIAVPNLAAGVVLHDGASSNSVGGIALTDRNVISGNGAHGVRVGLAGNACLHNIIVNNFIGVGIDGISQHGNANKGILIDDGAADNTVGPDNFIANNLEQGIRINGSDTRRNTILGNSITQNTAKGIGLDGCSQDKIQAPIITAISVSTVTGSASVADGSIIEVFHDPDFEGETFLGSTTVVGGQFSFSGTIPSGGTITATVTDLSGNTSEFGVLRPASPPQPPPLPGDLLVASRTFGTIYAVDRASGLIRGLVSGHELRDTSNAIRGEGTSLASFRTDLLSLPVNRILSRFGAGPCILGLAEVDHLTGDRLLRLDTNTPTWDEAGEAIQLDDDRILVTADHWNTGNESTVLRYELSTATTTIISGPTVGDGPVILRTRAIALLDTNTLTVIETGFAGPGVGIYLVDMATGNRSFLSRLSIAPFTRTLITNGVPAGDVILGDDEGGSGPVMNTQSRSVAVVRGRIFVGEAIQLPGGAFNGGILEIDPVTGDRTLLVGQAIEDDGTASNVVEVLPASATSVFFDSPIEMQDDGTGNLLFTTLFGPFSIFRYDLDTAELGVVSDIEAQVDPSFGPNLRLSGLTIFKGLPGDLDGDGDVDGDDFAIFLVSFGHCVGDPQFSYPANADGDECVTLVDYQIWLQNYRDFLANPLAAPPIPGDVGDMNADGIINGLDIQRFVEAVIAQNGAGLRQYLVADINGDGVLDTYDMGEFTGLLLSQQ